MTKWARAYVQNHDVEFKILQGGSDVGVSDVSRGRVTIGMSSRDPKDGDPGGIVFNRVARDALCLATNEDNKLGNLSQAQVQQIFSGGVRSWSQVQGASTGGTIGLFVRTAASGTQDAFQKIFMGTVEISSSASQKASNGLVQQSVRSNKGGIGYVSLAFTDGLNAVRYKGVGCSLRNAKSGQYGGTRNFWLITRGAAEGAAKKFIKWAKNSDAARRITATEWVPLS